MIKYAELVALEPYKLMSMQELMDTPEPPMLVEGILPMRTFTGLTAMPGVGKTWLSLDFARAVATAGKVLGKFQARMGNVVYVGQDASVHDYGRQIRKMCRTEFDQYEAEVEQGIRVANPFRDHIHFLVRAGITFENIESMRRLAATLLTLKHSEDVVISATSGEAEHVVSHGVDLIIFDTLTALTRMNQLDNTLMDAAFRNIRWLAEVTGAAIILLHHNSYPSEFNDGERFRGAGSMEAALDNWFQLTRVPGGYVRKDGEHRYRILLKVKRFRGLTPEDFHYKLTVNAETAKLLFEEPNVDTISPALRTAILGQLDSNDFRTSKAVRDLVLPTLDLIGVQATTEELLKHVRTVLNDESALVEKGPGGYRIKGVPSDLPNT